MEPIVLRGFDLRSLLVPSLLLRTRSGLPPMQVADLERAVAAAGVAAGPGRPGKAISSPALGGPPWPSRSRRPRPLRRRPVADVTKHRMCRRIDTARRLGHGPHIAA